MSSTAASGWDPSERLRCTLQGAHAPSLKQPRAGCVTYYRCVPTSLKLQALLTGIALIKAPADQQNVLIVRKKANKFIATSCSCVASEERCLNFVVKEPHPNQVKKRPRALTWHRCCCKNSNAVCCQAPYVLAPAQES